MFVKICGLTREEDVDVAIEAGADALGFVLADSPRQLGLGRAHELAAHVGGRAMTVAVVVDHDDLGSLERFDAVQVHGRTVGRHPRVIRAVDSAHALPGGDDWVLVDPSRGRGIALDWSSVDLSRSSGPVILSGGLTPDNVGAAIAAARPFGVDTSSGIEARPRVKDHDLVRRFVKEAKGR